MTLYYEILSATSIVLLMLLAAGVAITAIELRLLERGWNRYVDFLEPPDNLEEARASALRGPKSTEERARELDGRVPGTPSAALEETDQRRAWDGGDGNDEVV